MTKQQIIDELKGATSASVQTAFRQAEEKNGNFSYRFKKTWQYWTKTEWDIVAKEVKMYLA